MPKGIYVRSEQTLARLRERNRSPEMRAISSKQGRSNVINGHLAAIRPLAWAAPRSPEGLSVLIMNGKRQHARNVASGKNGFLVIRDTDPVCLASRITDALKTTGAF
jgi:hypothetical protein